MVKVNSIGDYLVIAWEGAVYITASRFRDGNVAVEPLLPAFDDGVGHTVKVLAGVTGVKGAYVHSLGKFQDA